MPEPAPRRGARLSSAPDIPRNHHEEYSPHVSPALLPPCRCRLHRHRGDRTGTRGHACRGPRGLRPRYPRTVLPPEGYAFGNAVRSTDGSVTLTYTGTAGDLRVTRLSSPDTPCPGPAVAGNEERIVQGHGILGRLVYENDDRSEDSLWLFRWEWNDAAFCMTGSLPEGEITKVASSIVE